MKVAYLTAGAGGMLCGSCMRDNTLAAALIRQGRDVVLWPLYSPIRTDEEDVSESRVFYGGINVFLQQKSSLFRHAPRAVDRLLNTPGLLRAAMRNAGSASGELAGTLAVSILRGEDGNQRKELDKLSEALAEYKPDIVHLPDALFVGLARELKHRLGATIVCTLTGEDILIDKLPEALRTEVVRLITERGRDVDGFLSVTRYYGDYASRAFGISPDRIRHVPIGVRVDDVPESATKPPGRFTIGYLARICPEKGLHILFDAFERLRADGRDCRLAVAGYLGESDRAYFEQLRRRMTDGGHHQRIDFLGEVDRRGKLNLFRSIDVLCVPTTYAEAKGIYAVEALAHGVPIVKPNHGAFPELIEATGGGLLFEPHNAADLAQRLARLMDDAPLRRQLGERGRAAVLQSFTDRHMADRAWEAFEHFRKVSSTRK